VAQPLADRLPGPAGQAQPAAVTVVRHRRHLRLRLSPVSPVSWVFDFAASSRTAG
jgi:hypothetical protein